MASFAEALQNKFKDTYREKTLSNKTQVLSMNMDIWVVGTSNQLCIKKVLVLQQNSQKVVTGKTQFFVIGPFCISHFLYRNIGFQKGIFVWKCCVFYRCTLN